MPRGISNIKRESSVTGTFFTQPTALAQKEVGEAHASGADGHLSKPLGADELRQKVQSLKQL